MTFSMLALTCAAVSLIIAQMSFPRGVLPLLPLWLAKGATHFLKCVAPEGYGA